MGGHKVRHKKERSNSMSGVCRGGGEQGEAVKQSESKHIGAIAFNCRGGKDKHQKGRGAYNHTTFVISVLASEKVVQKGPLLASEVLYLFYQTASTRRYWRFVSTPRGRTMGLLWHNEGNI